MLTDIDRPQAYPEIDAEWERLHAECNERNAEVERLWRFRFVPSTRPDYIAAVARYKESDRALNAYADAKHKQYADESDLYMLAAITEPDEVAEHEAFLHNQFDEVSPMTSGEPVR